MKTGSVCGAVDIGGTKISIGLVDREGTLLVRDVIPTPTQGDPEKTVKAVSSLLRSQAAAVGEQWDALAGIGIGASGPVDCLSGVIRNPYTLPGFLDYPIVKRMAAETGHTVVIDNDVNVSLLGEIKLGSLHDRTVLFTAFGTGVGVAVWFAGTGLYRAGTSGYHPELGHMIIDNDGPLCYCTNRGCLESTLSGKALNKRAEELGYRDFDRLYRAAGEHDQAAKQYLELCAKRLQRAFWNLLTIFKPEILYLGGGIVDAYYDFIRSSIEQQITPVFGFFEEFEIRRAVRDHGSAMAGASALIFGGAEAG